MTRIAIIALGLIGTTLAAAAMVPHVQVAQPVSVHETVIVKNQAWPKIGPLVFKDCISTVCEG